MSICSSPRSLCPGEGEREVVVGEVDWRYVQWRRGIGGSAGGAGAGRCGDGDVRDGFGSCMRGERGKGQGDNI